MIVGVDDRLVCGFDFFLIFDENCGHFGSTFDLRFKIGLCNTKREWMKSCWN